MSTPPGGTGTHALRHAGSAQQPVGWTGGQLGMDALHLCERPFQRGSAGPDWTAVPEGLLLHIGRFMDSNAASNARSVCKGWCRAFSLNVRTAQLEVLEHRAAQARAFLRAFIRAFPSTVELVLDVTFRRTAREKIQGALEEHFHALQDFGIQALQLNLDLNSFNERKIKVPDVSILSSWSGLTRLTLQESGWRSQQLRVDAGTVFTALPCLQELSVVCKYSGQVKAKWWRPPSPAERLAARMPTWLPAGASARVAAVMTTATTTTAAGGGALAGAGTCNAGSKPAAAAVGSGGDGDATMEEARHPYPSTLQQQCQPAGAMQPQLQAVAQVPSPSYHQLPLPLHPPGQQPANQAHALGTRPVVTQHLRCQMTQNQSMSGELAKALRRITPALQSQVSALTFEIVEETYAEPPRSVTPLELSALPGLKSLTVLSGAEDALANSRLDIVGATSLESLVIFDVSCGCWCYKKPGHGIPPRLLSAPPACLRSLTVVGFVINQCQNLHALSSLTCLEELRLEQPDPDSLAAVSGELLLSWLPPSLHKLKLHSVVLPPCGLELAAAPAVAEPLPFPPPLAAAAATAPLDGATTQLMYGVAPVAPLPLLRELYLSKCKVPSLGVLGMCPQLTSLGVINCLSCSGMLPVPAAMPELRNLALSHTLTSEQELGTTCAGGAIGCGPPSVPPAVYGAVAGAAGGGVAVAGRVCHASGGAAVAAAPPPPPLSPAVPAAASLHVSGLPLPPVVWGSDEQVAAVARCRNVASLELIVPRGSAGFAAVAALAAMPRLRELDVALPCGLSECMLGLAKLGSRGCSEVTGGGAAAGGGSRLQRLTVWVDSRACVNRDRSRRLQAIQRNLQAHMPDTLVEWAGAESRHSSWTGLEAKVFNAY